MYDMEAGMSRFVIALRQQGHRGRDSFLLRLRLARWLLSPPTCFFGTAALLIRSPEFVSRPAYSPTCLLRPVLPRADWPFRTCSLFSQAARMGLTTTTTAATTSASSLNSTTVNGGRRRQDSATTAVATARTDRQRFSQLHASSSSSSLQRVDTAHGSSSAPPRRGGQQPQQHHWQQRSSSPGGGDGGSGGDVLHRQPDGDSVGSSDDPHTSIGEEASAITALGTKNSGVEVAAAVTATTATEAPTPTAAAVAAPAAGVVIRVLISGAHASFLHIRVFPSTTAGQVRASRLSTWGCMCAEMKHVLLSVSLCASFRFLGKFICVLSVVATGRCPESVRRRHPNQLGSKKLRKPNNLRSTHFRT